MRTVLKQELKKFNSKEINFRKYQLARVTDNTEETILTNEDHCIITVIEAVLGISCLQKHMKRVCTNLILILAKYN